MAETALRLQTHDSRLKTKIMLAISLMRMGAKGKPFYRLVVKEKRSKRDGKYLENVGTYNPMLDPAEVLLNHDRIQYWIGVGAQPTDTVKSLIKNNPVQTEEEREASVQARAEKKAADDAEKLAAQQVEAERLASEKAEAEAAASEAASPDADQSASAEAAPIEGGSDETVAEETATADKASEETEASA